MLVGGFNPSEKYARQIGSFPQVGMNIKKNIWNHPEMHIPESFKYHVRIRFLKGPTTFLESKSLEGDVITLYLGRIVEDFLGLVN